MSLLDRDIPPECISVENLDYPFAWAWEMAAPLGMNVCMDVGHLFMQGIAPGDMFAAFREHIRVIHLHGVHGNRDHQAVDVLGEKEGGEIIEILSRHTGSVSLEVFRRSDWEASARWMLANLEAGRFTSLRTHSARG
jgi:sugar phosphate isomerase/epimerase